MSALILALIASICLAVCPQNLTNEYKNPDGVTHAATEVIDGITYQVFYLTGDDTANRKMLTENNKNTSGNYRYVLTADWDSPASGDLIYTYGNSIILDLNGYTFSVSGWLANQNHSYLSLYCSRFEVTDSSTAQTGTAISGSSLFVVWHRTDVIVSCGVFTGTIDVKVSASTVTFNGGSFHNNDKKVINLANGVTATVRVAPYMQATYDANGNLTAATVYDAYAVSTTPYATGIYNYAYGYRWKISAADLQKLAIPTDKTYYLWARDKDGWYEYLHLRYIDGAWQSAA